MRSPANVQGREKARPCSPLSSLSQPNLSQSPTEPLTSRDEISDSKPLESIEVKMPPKPKRRVVVKPMARKSRWDAESILTDPKSPLASADLRSVLSSPLAWTVLDKEDQEEILSLFPDNEHIVEDQREGRQPNFESLMNDDSFRYACASYTENIAQGRHDPAWLASAWSAHERRKAGEFDEYLMTKFEKTWAVELPEELRTWRHLPSAEKADSTAEPGDGDDVYKNETTDELMMGSGDVHLVSRRRITGKREMGQMKMDLDEEDGEDELA